MNDGPKADSQARDQLVVSTGLRGKVERLLRQNVRVSDIHDLYFSMRDEAGGKGLASEIANFIAHPAGRTRGMSWQDTRDAFAILKLRMDVSPIITRDMPATVPDTLKGNLRRMRKSTLTRELGLNRSQAGAVLERVLSRLVPTAPGRVSKLTFVNQEEHEVLVCIASHLKGGSLFTANDLFEDFSRGLQRLGVLRASEKQMLKRMRPVISLFALAAMHNKTIDLGDGTCAKIAITGDMRGNLGAFAFAEVTKDYGHGATTAGIWLFETGLSIQEHCDPETAPLDRSPFVGDFELGPQLRLARV